MNPLHMYIGTPLENYLDKDPEVREAAATGLSMLSSDAVPLLTRALRDEDWRVREGSAQALGWIGPQAWDTIPALIDALSDERKEVRVSAGLALTAITDQDFGYNRAAWQRWWEKQ